MNERTPLPPDVAVDDAPRALHEAEDGLCRHALPGSRLADEGDGLASIDLKRHPPDGVHLSGAGVELHPEVAHFEQARSGDGGITGIQGGGDGRVGHVPAPAVAAAALANRLSRCWGSTT